MYILVLLLVLNGQVIEEKRGDTVYLNYIDCSTMGSKILATKPKKVEVVFQCREISKKGTM